MRREEIVYLQESFNCLILLLCDALYRINVPG